MKRIIALLLSVTVFATTNFAQDIKDPNVQLREAKDFHAISVSSAFDVYLTQGTEEKVAVSASETKYLEHIKVEVKNGVLVVGVDDKGKWFKGNKKLKAYISFKSISSLSASGACNVNIVGSLKADNLKVGLSGASDVKGKLEVGSLDVVLSGASDMKVSGTTSSVDIDASGASSFKGFDFAADVCKVQASGASDIKITVNKELSAHASGASDIGYKGNAVIKEVHTGGASSISHKS